MLPTMKTMTLLLCAALAIGASMRVAANDTSADSGNQFDPTRDDINGTYVSDGSMLGRCDIGALEHGVDIASPRVMWVVYTRGIMTLRVAPPQTLRLLHVSKNPQAKDEWEGRRYNGLGRWKNGQLIVESAPPAIPLWAVRPATHTTSMLHEQFTFSRESLTYRAAYRLGAEAFGEALEVTLWKCASTMN